MRLLWATCLLSLLWVPLACGQSEPTLGDAKIELMLEKPDNTLRILHEFRRIHGEVPIATFLLLAEAYKQKGDTKAALAACQEGERHFQDSPEIAFCIAEILVETNPALPGVEYYLKRAGGGYHSPKYGNNNVLYAHWAYALGKYELCIEKASAALTGAWRPGTGNSTKVQIETFAVLGKAHARLEQYEKAERAFLWSIQYNREQYARAREARKSPAVPDDARIRLNGVWNDFLTEPAMDFVRFLNNRGRKADADFLNAEIRSIEPDYLPSLLFSARRHAEEQEFSEAARTAESALAKVAEGEPLEAEIRDLLHEIYTRMGQPEKARTFRNGPHS